MSAKSETSIWKRIEYVIDESGFFASMGCGILMILGLVSGMLGSVLHLLILLDAGAWILSVLLLYGVPTTIVLCASEGIVSHWRTTTPRPPSAYAIAKYMPFPYNVLTMQRLTAPKQEGE